MKKTGGLVLNNDNFNFIFITCGDWDLRIMLPSQCNQFKIDYPPYFRKWINLKKVIHYFIVVIKALFIFYYVGVCRCNTNIS